MCRFRQKQRAQNIGLGRYMFVLVWNKHDWGSANRLLRCGAGIFVSLGRKKIVTKIVPLESHVLTTAARTTAAANQQLFLYYLSHENTNPLLINDIS